MSRTKQMKSDQWTQIKHEILSRLDIISEYKELGLDVTGHDNGDWVECRAFGKQDRNPSAQINVSRTTWRGCYKDFTASEKAMSLFDFSIQVACRFGSFMESLSYYAQKTGVEIPKKKHPCDSVIPVKYNSMLSVPWFQSKKPITEQSFFDAGGILAKYPGKNGDVRIALPVYGVQSDIEPPIGWIIWHRMGMDMEWEQGGEIIRRKMQTVSGSESGLIGLRGLKNIHQAEIAFKVEGPTDLLTLESMIPESEKQKYAVITNSGGATETPKSWQSDTFTGKIVFVVPDADKPGVDGAEKWAASIACSAKEVFLMSLPYEIEKSHGKDLRDYFTEGNTFDDFLALRKNAIKIEKTKERESSTEEDENILKTLGLEVIGKQGDEIIMFSHNHKHIITIRDINKYTYYNLIGDSGVAKNKVLPGNTKPEGTGFYTFHEIKCAIAQIAGERKMSGNMVRGQGIWDCGEKDIVIIGKGEAAIWDGETLEPWDKPQYKNLIIDMAGDCTFYDFAKLKNILENFDHEKARKVFHKVFDTFMHWSYHKSSAQGPMPWVLTGLVYATWVQSIWNWRPQVSITGASHSGKTTMLDFIAMCFGDHLVKGVKLTEAAIRQSVGVSSKAVIIDEFEEDHNRRKTMELVRVAGGGGHVHRGTAGGKIRTFGLAHIFWFAAIELGMNDEADKNRFIEVVLERPKGNAKKLKIPSRDEMQEISTWIMTTSIYYAKKVKAIVDQLKYHSIQGIDIRVVEQYALPAAIVSIMDNEFECKNPEYTPEFFLEQFISPRKEIIRSVHDEEQIIIDILSSTTRTLNNEEKTIGQLIDDYCKDINKESSIKALEKVGISISLTWSLISPNRGFVFMWRTAIEKHLLQNTKWKGKNINHILRNIEGAYEGRARLAGMQPRGMFIPLESLDLEDCDHEDEF